MPIPLARYLKQVMKYIFGKPVTNENAVACSWEKSPETKLSCILSLSIILHMKTMTDSCSYTKLPLRNFPGLKQVYRTETDSADGPWKGHMQPNY